MGMALDEPREEDTKVNIKGVEFVYDKADEGFIKNRDSERRVFYVGATRAKKSLHIIRSNSSREFTEIFQ